MNRKNGDLVKKCEDPMKTDAERKEAAGSRLPDWYPAYM